MNNNYQDIDNELASWTDQVLAGNAEDAPEELGDLADVVRQLKRSIAPESLPTPAFRANLQNILQREWSHRPQQKRFRFVWGSSRVVNLSLAAASIAAALLIVVLLTGQEENATQGTSTGALSWVFGAIAAAVVAVGAGAWFFKGRRK